MFKQIALAIVLASLGSSLLAADPAPQGAGKVLDRFLDQDVVAVTRIDVAKVDLNGFLSLDDVVSGSLGRWLQQMKLFATDWRQKFLAAGGREIYFVSSLTPDQYGAAYLLIPCGADAKKDDINNLLSKQLWNYHFTASKNIGDVLIIGSQHVADKFGDQFKPTPRPEFSAALTATAGASVQIAVALSTDQRRAVAELGPELPKQLGVSTRQIVTAVDWLSVAWDISGKPQGKIVVSASNQANAGAASEFLAKAMKYAATAPLLPKSVRAALDSGKLKPQVDGQVVSMGLGPDNDGVKTMTALLTDFTSRWFDYQQRIQTRNNLKFIVLGLHNFSDSHDNRFPPSATEAKTGKPSLSWRVQILPFVDDRGLLAKFHQDEPWDSPHNLTLLNEMPDIYATLGQDRSTGMTQYQLPKNKGMAGGSPTGFQIKDVTDGTSASIFVLHVDPSKAVPWTKPDDFEVDLKNPWKGLVTEHDEGIFTGFIDGSGRYLPKTLGDDLLKYLTIGGGEVVP